MQAFLPMLVVRTRESTAAVEMNGTLVGEASPDEHLTVPLSDNGEYYIGIYPLKSSSERCFPVVRKLRFIKGELQPVESDDVEAYAWPDGVFEAVFAPGVLPNTVEPAFPFTVDQIKLGTDKYATLYYDNGLKLAIEEAGRVRYGSTLGGAFTGSLILRKNELITALAGEPKLKEGDTPAGYANTVVVIDAEYQEIFRLTGDAVGLRNDDEIVCFSRLNTMRKHEEKQIYRYEEGAYQTAEPEIGFFLHSPEIPRPGEQMIRAFCDAIRYNLWDEAVEYLSASLRDGLSSQIIRDCMGEFTGVRTPLARQNSSIGLLYRAVDGIVPVRVFTFAFKDGFIDNISED